MATLQGDYDEQVKHAIDEERVRRRVAELQGPIGGTMPPMPGTLGVSPLTPAQRIAELAQLVAEAGHVLQMARAKFNEAQEGQAIAEKGFIEVSERLMQAMHEHREGIPEGVPYGGLRSKEMR